MVSARSATGLSPLGFGVDARLVGQRTLPPCLVQSPASRFPKTCLLLTRFSRPASVFVPRSPAGLGTFWGSCLNAAFAGTVAHRDSKAWIDFLLLPSLVLPSPARGGSSRTRRSTNETRRRCQDWLNGVRLDLWDHPQRTSFSRASTHKPQASLEPSFDLDERTAARVHTLITEGALRRALLTRLLLPLRLSSMSFVFSTLGPLQRIAT